MTIEAAASEQSYACDGVTTTFAIPFPFDTSGDLKVILTDSGGTAAVLSSGYSVAGGGGSTGTITTTTAYAAGNTLTVLDDPARTQTADYTDNDSFPADVHEAALDRNTRLAKRLYQLIKQCLRVSDGDPQRDSGMTLPTVASRKGKFLRFNSTTGAIEVADVSTTVGAISQSIIAALLYPQSTGEAAAGATPTDYSGTYVDVLRFGATGDGSTDDSASVQRALDVSLLTGQRVHFPSRNRNGQTVYRCNGVRVYANTHVTADHGVIIEKNGGAAFTNIFNATSTLGTATALTANGTKGASSVVVTSNSGLSVGQLVLIRDATYKFSTSGRNLELNEIDGIAGTTITLRNRLIGNYATASTAELVPVTTPARKIKFENVQCRVPSGGTGGAFYFQEAYDCDVVNSGCVGMEDQGGVQTWRSAYIRIRGGRYADGQNQSTAGKGYGISFGEASHHCQAIGVQTTNVRENAFGANVRHSQFIDCIAVGSYDNGFNSHANGVEDCDVVNCSVYSSRSFGFVAGFTGSNAADKRIRFINCRSYDSGSYGFWTGADVGRENEDIEFIDCVAIRPGVTSGNNYGFLISRCTRPKVINPRVIGSSANVRAGGIFEVCTDAYLKGGEVRDVTSGWGWIHQQCTGVTIEGLRIQDVGSNQGVYGPATASTKVVVRNCRVNNDTPFTKNSGDIVEGIEYDTKRQSNRGAASSVADGGTITHGLVSTPTNVRCTTSVAGEFVSVTSVGSSTFTVAIKKHDNTAGTSQTVHWEAEV